VVIPARTGRTSANDLVPQSLWVKEALQIGGKVHAACYLGGPQLANDGKGIGRRHRSRRD
jgi:hypothetical protein